MISVTVIYSIKELKISHIFVNFSSWILTFPKNGYCILLITWTSISRCLTTGLSTRVLWSASDADRGSVLKDHFLIGAACCTTRMTVREIQLCSAMRVVCVPRGAHAKPHWIQIGDADPVIPVSMLVWRVPLFQSIWI